MNGKPIVKWAGGKRQLIDKLIELLPKNYNHYYEPFIGGGALLFELMPHNATINDINEELYLIYKCLQNEEDFQNMLNDLKEHENNHSDNYFYEIRSVDRDYGFKDLPIWKRASRTIYLNKSCFNGLYRVNSKGFFNVPSGKKEKVKTYDIDNISLLHEYFMKSNIRVLNIDFIDAVADVKAGDFVYFDPPYDSYENKESFTSYTKFDFTKDDQIRLANLFKDLNKKGVNVMLSNHNTNFINELYKEFNINIVDAKRMINSNSKGRGAVEEVIITNY